MPSPKAVLEELDRLTAALTKKPKRDLITGDEVKYHEDPARKDMVLPQGMTYSRAYDVLERMHRASETVEQLEPERFPNRPNDVAVAVARVLQRRYGMTYNAGVSSFFGEEPPTFKSVPVSLTETVEVATGRILIPELERAEIFVGEWKDREMGVVGAITATMKRKDRSEVRELLADIRKELRDNSIYRGKALKINGDAEPQFMDVSKFPTMDQIVYSAEALAALEGSVLHRLRFREELASEGVAFKSSCLVYGPYGTGKSSFGQIAALDALKHGVTVIFADAGADVNQLLQTGRLYGPCLVFVEDIDTYASSGEEDAVSKFLDAFDGVTAKGGDVMVIMTTNNIERIHKGFLRPGRVDACVEIAYLDVEGVEKLVKANVPAGKLDDNIDYVKLFTTVDNYTPAFIADAVKRAKIHAIGRVGGKHRNYKLTTDDLVSAALQLKGHHDLMERATEGQRKPTLDRIVEEKLLLAAQGGINGAKLTRDGEKVLGEMVVAGS